MSGPALDSEEYDDGFPELPFRAAIAKAAEEIATAAAAVTEAAHETARAADGAAAFLHRINDWMDRLTGMLP